MSLLPLLFEDYYRPSRVLNQNFGLTLDPEDFIAPIVDQRLAFRNPVGYIRPWASLLSRNDVGSTISNSKDKFEANLDVQQFKPEEITVKATGDNVITIEGKHEEQQDEHGFISRHFVRRYVLPKDCDVNKIESKLSSDGVLTISAPKLAIENKDHKEIPVVQTGKPVKGDKKEVAGKK